MAHVDADYMALDRDVDANAIEQARAGRSRNAFFAENRSGAEVRYDFSYANLQHDSFPVNTWRKLVDEVLYRAQCPELARYSYTDEPNALRAELARHLARTRGAHCLPEQVIVQAGTDGALAAILQLFDRSSDVLGMEEPGYATVHEVARRQGFAMVPLPTDQGTEEFLEALEKRNPRMWFSKPAPENNVMIGFSAIALDNIEPGVRALARAWL